MAFGKTPEQKAAEAQQKADAAYWASPLGQAQRAVESGSRFFQVEIPHATMSGYSNMAWGSGDVRRTTHHGGAPDLLGQIEQLGWRLEHASWVFIETGQSSRDKVLASGQATTVTGRVVGIYLFRRVGG